MYVEQFQQFNLMHELNSLISIRQLMMLEDITFLRGQGRTQLQYRHLNPALNALAVRA